MKKCGKGLRARGILCAQESMITMAIVEAFKDLPEPRRKEGKRHQQALCLALVVSEGNRGFLAMGDWLKSYNNAMCNKELGREEVFKV